MLVIAFVNTCWVLSIHSKLTCFLSDGAMVPVSLFVRFLQLCKESEYVSSDTKELGWSAIVRDVDYLTYVVHSL